MTIEQLLKKVDQVQKKFNEVEYFLQLVQELKDKLDAYEIKDNNNKIEGDR